ncbi:DUF1642 domain-containing protein [Lactiplantibacillus plantarum]|uniref:DUF1642 domain-containing protein n=1 Tax=Lactiplantibacillus plantarum TaxID=1590 RepID=UPI000CDE21BD|nr:DUF1642 domain-containing protein [Lactiplantibacillus plantarum]
MIKIYRKTDTIRAEQFDGTSDSANRMGVEWDNGNGFIGDPSYTPESQPGWYVPEDKFTVLGYDENSIKPDDWIIECSGNIRLIMTNNEFKKDYAELPVIPRVWADTIEEYKTNHYPLDEMSNEWDWNYDEQELIARAWLDGYVVEEEK